MASIKEAAQDLVDTRQRWVSEAFQTKTLVESILPEDLYNLEVGYASCDFNPITKEVSLLLSPPYEARKQEAELAQWVEQTKWLFSEVLAVNWEPKISLSYNGTPKWEGSSDYRGYKVLVSLYSVPKPPLCRIVEKVETKEVKTYEAICPGEEGY